MGLDIEGVSHVEFLRGREAPWDVEPTADDFALWGDRELLMVNDHAFDPAELPMGLYRRSPASAKHDFHMSYGGFRTWCYHLSRCALGVNWEEVVSRPKAFAGEPALPLLVFPGQGYFGPTTAAALAGGLRRLLDRARAYESATVGAEGFLWAYEQMVKAAELGGCHGWLRFY